MPGTSSINCVAERQKRTQKDKVRSMISYTILPKSLWEEVLKLAAYILNRVLTKVVAKTLYELWTNKKPIIKYLHI